MFLRLSVLLCLGLSLVACGGGAGSTTSNQNANGSHAVIVTRVSPSNLSSATSPVNFDFKASSQTPIKGWTVTVDSKQVFQTGATSEMQTSLAISAGNHQVSVQASNSNGTTGSSDFALTVVSGSPTPTPTPTPKPSPTPTPTPTPAPSPSPTPTPAPTPSPSPTPSPTPPPGANDFFVSPSGSDSNNGSASAPWATLQHAADSVRAGDTVLVADGTYNQCNGAIVNITTSGAPSAPITFQSQNKWGAKLVGDTSCMLGFAVRASYINIKDFDISGFGATSSQGIYLASGSNHIVFGNIIHNIANIFLSNSYGNDGIFVQTSNDIIDSNIIHDVGRTNTVNLDHGMYIDPSLGASGTIIQNNLVYNTPQGWPIQIYPGAGSGFLVINNTLNSGDNHNNGDIVIGATLTNSRIANNLMIGNLASGIDFHNLSTSGDSLTVENNLTTSASMQDVTLQGGVTFTNNRVGVSTSGLVANLANNDYHLVSGSPAIGAGTSVGAPATDIEGTSRSQLSRYDVGAYENPQ